MNSDPTRRDFIATGATAAAALWVGSGCAHEDDEPSPDEPAVCPSAGEPEYVADLSAADYVIVGGGIYGAGLAWELARRGAEVLVLERDLIASGASGGRGRRGLRSNGRDPRELPLAALAQQIWPQLSAELGVPIGYERIGQLDLIEQPGALEDAIARAERQQQVGIATRIVEAGELAEMEPYLAASAIAAIHCPDDGVVDHEVTTKAMARSAVAAGARIRERASVGGFEIEAGRVTAVITAMDERVPVKREVIVLANAGASKLLSPLLGFSMPTFNVLPQILITEPLETMSISHLVGHVQRPLALKLLPGGELMISGGRLGVRNPDTGCGETADAQVEANIRDAVAMFPALEDLPPPVAIADRFEAIAPGLSPTVDRAPLVANAIFGVGWSGSGFAIAPAVTRQLADWAVTGVKPALLDSLAL